jgi:hypothetical protein
MSVKIMSMVWEHAPYSENKLIVLLALADWANDEGVSWPSMERLAQKARVDRRSARRIVRTLESDEIIAIDEGGGRAKQNKYTINLTKLCSQETGTQRPSLEKEDITKEDTGGQERGTLGAQRRTLEVERGTLQPPDPLEDPLEDPPLEPSVPFSSESFTQALSAFVAHRKEIKKPLRPTGLAQLYRDLGNWGEAAATEALTSSVRNGWQGVFRPDSTKDNDAPSGYAGTEKILEDFGDWYTVMGCDGTPSKRFRTAEAFARHSAHPLEEVLKNWN